MRAATTPWPQPRSSTRGGTEPSARWSETILCSRSSGCLRSALSSAFRSAQLRAKAGSFHCSIVFPFPCAKVMSLCSRCAVACRFWSADEDPARSSRVLVTRGYLAAGRLCRQAISLLRRAGEGVGVGRVQIDVLPSLHSADLLLDAEYGWWPRRGLIPCRTIPS
jgi:hypothetical protein